MIDLNYDRIVGELQMIVGEVVDDINYLVAKVFAGSEVHNLNKTEDDCFVKTKAPIESKIVDLDEWFDAVGEE